MPCASFFSQQVFWNFWHYFQPTIIHLIFIGITRTVSFIQPSNITNPTFHFILKTIYITKTVTILQYIRHSEKSSITKHVEKPVVHRKTIGNRKHKGKMSFSRGLEVLASFLHWHAVAFFIPGCGMSQRNKTNNKRNLWKCEMYIRCIHDYNIVLKRSNLYLR